MVGQLTVVCDGDLSLAVIDNHGLSIDLALGSSCRITYVSDCDVSYETTHLLFAQCVGHKTVTFDGLLRIL